MDSLVLAVLHALLVAVEVVAVTAVPLVVERLARLRVHIVVVPLVVKLAIASIILQLADVLVVNPLVVHDVEAKVDVLADAGAEADRAEALLVKPKAHIVESEPAMDPSSAAMQLANATVDARVEPPTPDGVA